MVAMEEKSPRIPLEVNGIQHNHCKNPNCNNFGIPAETTKATYGSNSYIVVGGSKGGENVPHLKCNSCGEVFPMKSNQGIKEELDRISSYLALSNASDKATCPNGACTNHAVPITTPKAYRSFGTSSSGSKRVQCCSCKKTFSIKQKPTVGQHETHKNIDIFMQLMNKVPLRRIVHMTGISFKVLYNRIDFIHQQCLKFSADRENNLKDMSFDRMYISVDRQDYTVNWADRKDKRNVVLQAITSVDNTTGYVLAMQPNFDPSLNKDLIEAKAQAINDNGVKEPFRKYARLWLDKDYQEAALRNKQRRKKAESNSLASQIESKYSEADTRDDVERFEELTNTEQLPSYGIQIKSEYTMMGHFRFLKTLIPNVGKWRFFLDQESGIRSAVLSAFLDEVKTHTAEAFYVSIEKELTVDEKRKFKAESKKRFDEIKDKNPSMTDDEVKLEMLMDEIRAVKEIGKWQDRWVKHPLPNMAEANKQVCWLTEHTDFDLNHQAWLYNKASLHGVDSFFQKVRRRIAMMERPLHSSSNAGRVWNGYGAYNPAMIGKLLDIFRVVHNYIDIKKEDKMTPAMRMGLAKAPLHYKDILYFEG